MFYFVIFSDDIDVRLRAKDIFYFMALQVFYLDGSFVRNLSCICIGAVVLDITPHVDFLGSAGQSQTEV